MVQGREEKGFCCFKYTGELSKKLKHMYKKNRRHKLGLWLSPSSSCRLAGIRIQILCAHSCSSIRATSYSSGREGRGRARDAGVWCVQREIVHAGARESARVVCVC
jgi:hypothetical protein